MLPMELDPDDDLILRVQTSVDNADVSGRARVFRHGRVDFVPLQFPSPTSDRAQYNTSIGLGGGTLLGARISTALATAKRGQIYAQLEVRNRRRTDVSEVMLCKGYVYAGNSVGDGEFVESGPGGGEGNIRTVTGTNPGAGVEITETVPTNAVWRLLSFSAVFVATGAANRFFNLIADDGTTANRRAVYAASNTAITDTQTRTILVTFGQVTPGSSANTSIADTDTLHLLAQMTDSGLLPEGYRLRSWTNALQAGDDYAAPIFQVEEWVVI